MISAMVDATNRFKAVLLPAGCCLLLTALLPAAGCTKAPAKKAKPAAGTAVAEAGAADEGDGAVLEGVDFDTAIEVDEGRIEACSPTGWIRGGQSKDYLVKYTPSRKKTYPSIVVTAADAPDGMAEVDGDTQKDSSLRSRRASPRPTRRMARARCSKSRPPCGWGPTLVPRGPLRRRSRSTASRKRSTGPATPW
jgi:hypothetical protein